MSEETPETQEQPSEKGGGGIFKIAIAAVIILCAAGGGFGTYRFVLAPMLAPPETEEDREPKAYIPSNPVALDFIDNFVNVIMEEKGVPASTLVFAVTFECNNQATADFVSMHMARFTNLVNNLHQGRTREELDQLGNFEESVQRQLMQKANALLQRLQIEPQEDIRITGVFHRVLMVDDKL